MKLHLVTIGQPKLDYAKTGWHEYTERLKRLHQLRITHLNDKQNNSQSILAAAGSAYKVGLVIEADQLTSHELADFLEKRSQTGQEVCFMVGGPDGLPQVVIDSADQLLSFSKLTFPHDLAMVILSEALYRASSINKGHPYHH